MNTSKGRKTHQTRKEHDTMKKNTLMTLHAFLNGQTDIDLSTVREDVNAEVARLDEKANSNRELYAAAYMAIDAFLTDVPMTAKAIAEECPDLPAGFSANKITYAMRNYWSDKFKRHENGKAAFTYSK